MSEIYFADQLVKTSYKTDLKGSYQKHNTKTAVQALKILSAKTYPVSEAHIIEGLQNVVKNTDLKGRWQLLQEHPKVVCDTAHNKEGLTYIVEQLKNESFQKLHMVFGVVNDKDVDAIMTLLPKEATYYFCKPNVPRGLDATVLQTHFISNGFQGEVYSSVNNALANAKANASIDDLIYVGGSTFVVAEIV